MEDMRFAVDRIVLRLVRLRQLRPEDFKMRLGRCAFARGEAFKTFLATFEDMMAAPFDAPCAKPGIAKGARTCLNHWLDASAHAYGDWLRRSTPYEPLRAA
jgi:CRISPR/Cas system-associated endonuclease Cas1